MIHATALPLKSPDAIAPSATNELIYGVVWNNVNSAYSGFVGTGGANTTYGFIEGGSAGSSQVLPQTGSYYGLASYTAAATVSSTTAANQGTWLLTTTTIH